jgi:hypothetical protein
MHNTKSGKSCVVRGLGVTNSKMLLQDIEYSIFPDYSLRASKLPGGGLK